MIPNTDRISFAAEKTLQDIKATKVSLRKKGRLSLQEEESLFVSLRDFARELRDNGVPEPIGLFPSKITEGSLISVEALVSCFRTIDTFVFHTQN